MRDLIVLLIAMTAATNAVEAQDWERKSVDLGMVESIARDLSNRPYKPSDKTGIPEWLGTVKFDQYGDLVSNPGMPLWKGEDRPFRVMFHHPSFLFTDPVKINEFTDSHRQSIRFSESFFDYRGDRRNHGKVPGSVSFSGFKILSQLNKPGKFDELVSFRGSTYWRGLGRNQRYGISARGLAVDAGIEGTEEEFPIFREFWLGKAKKGDRRVMIYALLDSKSCTGAYSFSIEPGETTFMEVAAVIFPRKDIKRLGIAPMSSMFWFGENSRKRFDDFRPEVHDSDGLSIRSSTGERIWRPLSNDTGKLEFSFFKMEKCDGFGLLQRDRRFDAYEDAEVYYEKRPSLWIEPTSDWGAGSVMLMEIPTDDEHLDNIAAMWVPKREVKAGDRLEFRYRQHWTREQDPARGGGDVLATRTGLHDWQPEQRTMIVEFGGEDLGDSDTELPAAMVECSGGLKVLSTALQRMENGKIRLNFQIAPAEEGVKLEDVEAAELRAALKRGDNYLTETWVYRIKP